MFGYCFYYYLFRSDMSGFMQTSFYFGAPLLILMPPQLVSSCCASWSAEGLTDNAALPALLAGYMALICYGEANMMRSTAWWTFCQLHSVTTAC